ESWDTSSGAKVDKLDDYTYRITNTTNGRWGNVNSDSIFLRDGESATVSFEILEMKGDVRAQLRNLETNGRLDSYMYLTEGRNVKTFKNDTGEDIEVSFWFTPYGDYASNDGTQEITVKKVKLEKGNKATDWSPAPEDMDARMTATETTIKQLPDEIDLAVKEGVGALEIGGTNLVGEFNFYPWSRTVAGGARPSTVGSSYIVKVTPNTDYIIHRETTKYNNRFRIYFYNTDSDNPEDIEGRIDEDETKGYVKDSELSFKFTTESDTRWLYIYLSNDVDQRDDIKNNKPRSELEKGDKVTDWSPAPEDMFSESEQ